MRSKFRNTVTALMASATLMAPSLAHATLVISNKPTQNMYCDSGGCGALTPQAVLNVADLTAMLGQYSTVRIKANIAKSIVISAAFSWTSSSMLSLSAPGQMVFSKPVSVAGQGGLTVASRALRFLGKGSVGFWNSSSNLTINGQRYVLANDIATFGKDIRANPSGNYALARDYDAAADGVYETSPINGLYGKFEGLGNTISNLAFATQTGSAYNLGLFGLLFGNVSDLNLTQVSMQDNDPQPRCFGPLAYYNEGAVSNVFVSGVFNYPQAQSAVFGGIGCANVGMISDSHVHIALNYLNGYARQEVGGIVGWNDGSIVNCYAEGALHTSEVEWSPGGIAGANTGIIKNSYSLAKIDAGSGTAGIFGGLVGDNGGVVISSYAAGKIEHEKRYRGTVGGLVGYEENQSGGLSQSYWDLGDGVSDPSEAVGNIPNYPGGTGLTTAQFKSGLPEGFDTKIWAENPNINNGYPYLIDNPPVK